MLGISSKTGLPSLLVQATDLHLNKLFLTIINVSAKIRTTMTLSYFDTKNLIDLVLISEATECRRLLFDALKTINSNEGQFYDGIVEHSQSLHLTNDQWFELLSRLPNRILRSGLDLPGLLSESQLKQLPPISG
jgi:hypothetical protein